MQIHVARDGHRMGPFSLEEVNRQLATGSLNLTDLAWYEGIPNWIALSEVPGIVAGGAIPATGGMPIATPAGTGGEYAGFWIRLIAYIFDGIILAIPLTILNFVLRPNPNDPGSGHPILLFVLTVVFEVAYFAGLWASTMQATIGQRICGLRVVNATDLGPISFAQGVGRFFAMWLSALILCIGFIMIAFTERKQGLHDMIVGTYVIKS